MAFTRKSYFTIVVYTTSGLVVIGPALVDHKTNSYTVGIVLVSISQCALLWIERALSKGKLLMRGVTKLVGSGDMSRHAGA